MVAAAALRAQTACIVPCTPWQIDLRESWLIGAVEVPTRLVLAPMAGVSVQAFRRQGRRFGAGLVCSEMVSLRRDRAPQRADARLPARRVGRASARDPDLRLRTRPRWREAARMVEAAGADIVDINFGCPVRKVTKTGAGATLLDEPDLACRIVAAVADGGRRARHA